jgi:hypothetical protein
MESHGTLRNPIEPHGTLWNMMEPYGTADKSEYYYVIRIFQKVAGLL